MIWDDELQSFFLMHSVSLSWGTGFFFPETIAIKLESKETECMALMGQIRTISVIIAGCTLIETHNSLGLAFSSRYKPPVVQDLAEGGNSIRLTMCIDSS